MHETEYAKHVGGFGRSMFTFFGICAILQCGSFVIQFPGPMSLFWEGPMQTISPRMPSRRCLARAGDAADKLEEIFREAIGQGSIAQACLLQVS